MKQQKHTDIRLKTAEDAWLGAKRRSIANPSNSNVWAEKLLYKSFRKIWKECE